MRGPHYFVFVQLNTKFSLERRLASRLSLSTLNHSFWFINSLDGLNLWHLSCT